MHKFMLGDKVFCVNDFGQFTVHDFPLADKFGYRVGEIITITISSSDDLYIYEVIYPDGKIDTLEEDALVAYVDDEKYSKYINIKFQEGSAKKEGVNGCQITDVIDVLIDEIEGKCYHSLQFQSIHKLREAKQLLDLYAYYKSENHINNKKLIEDMNDLGKGDDDLDQ